MSAKKRGAQPGSERAETELIAEPNHTPGSASIQDDAGIVSEVARLHSDIRAAAERTLTSASRIGELLLEKKNHLLHGQWLAWLSANVPFCAKTAQNYIRVFQNRDRLKSENVSRLRGAYRLLADSAKTNEPSLDPLDIPIATAVIEKIRATLPEPTDEELERLDDWDFIAAICLDRLFTPGHFTRREIDEILAWAKEQRELRRGA